MALCSTAVVFFVCFPSSPCLLMLTMFFFSTLVGWSAYFCRICVVLLDPCTYSILYQCTFLLFFSLSISSSLKSWDLAYFPITSNEPFDRFGNTYNVSSVLLPNDTFNETAYNHYSPLYLSTTYAMTYLLSFALSTCALVHTALYHGKSLIDGVRKIRGENDDIHAKLMRNYREVPDWWYFMVFIFFFCVAVIAVKVGYWFILSFWVKCWLFSFVGLGYGGTGLGVIALCNSSDCLYTTFWIHLCHDGSRCTIPHHSLLVQPIWSYLQININVIAQIIPGTLLPGKPFANMIFKAYSVQSLAVGTSFTQDLKLGHYVKVPPRSTFMGMWNLHSSIKR